MQKKTIGMFLKNERETRLQQASKKNRKLYSLRGVAKRMGISNVYLYYVESGKNTNPSTRMLKKFSIEYKIPVSKLIRMVE